jgi:protein-disulfide isomerase
MRKNLMIALPLLFMFVVMYAQTGCEIPDASGIREQLKELIELEKANQKDLQEIKKLLASKGAPAPAPAPQENVVLNIDKAPFKGKKDAKVTLIEFSDFQCPFCGRNARNTIPQLDKEYIETGKVKYVFKDFPLESIHKNAFKAAEAANCAGDQGKYWEMHNKLFENQRALSTEDLIKYAGELNLDKAKFEKCLDSGTYASKVRESISEGQKAGVTGTPAFFLALDQGNDSEVKTSKKIVGAQPYANFKSAIDELLSSQNK